MLNRVRYAGMMRTCVKRSFFIMLLALCMHLPSLAQKIDCLNRTYTPDELKRDLDYLLRYLPKFHPDPYRFITKDSLAAFVQAQKARIDSPLTEREFRVLVKQVVAKIGCGHTDINASRAYAKAIVCITRPYLPVDAMITDSNRIMAVSSLIVTKKDMTKDSVVCPGDEILSIDGHSAPEIIRTVYSIYTSDGYNTTSKRQGTRLGWFKYYYGQCFGYHQEYVLGIRHQGQVSEVHVNTALSQDTLSLPAKPSQDTLYKTKTCSFWIDHQNRNLAVIRINSFDGRGWRSFHRKTFRYIRRHHLTNLAVDLRDNGGGNIGKGLYFMTYLIPHAFKISFDRRPNLLPLSCRLHMSIATRLTPVFFSLTPLEVPRHGHLRHYLFGIPDHRNSYRNALYVLVNGKSFSMSCITASYLKAKAAATIVGEETGGGAEGSNAVVGGKLYLPHTGVNISIPLYHIYHDVPAGMPGRGVMPDYPTHYTVGDILKGRDLEMEQVRKLIAP